VILQGNPIPPMPPDVPQVPEFPIIWTADDITRLVVLSLAGVVVLAWIIARGPIGHAIGDVLRRWLGGSQPPKELAGELEQLRTQIEGLQRQLGDLAERQDFAERMLAQARRDKVLPGAGDVPR
jgi:hypothetical protein